MRLLGASRGLCSLPSSQPLFIAPASSLAPHFVLLSLLQLMALCNSSFPEPREGPLGPAASRDAEDIASKPCARCPDPVRVWVSVRTLKTGLLGMPGLRPLFPPCFCRCRIPGASHPTMCQAFFSEGKVCQNIVISKAGLAEMLLLEEFLLHYPGYV